MLVDNIRNFRKFHTLGIQVSKQTWSPEMPWMVLLIAASTIKLGLPINRRQTQQGQNLVLAELLPIARLSGFFSQIVFRSFKLS